MVSQFRKSPLALFVTSFVSLTASATVLAQQAEQEAHEHEDTEVIVVTASPLNRTALESAQPISVMAGDELREQHAHTLGETLAHEPGVNATHFAGVASSPIIRGLDGPRVKITQNGLDSGDVSRGSPDHAVTTETSVAQQIEIFRGPATLLYGSGAIGGVVNVVDNRIAQELTGGTNGFYGTKFDSASNLREGTAGFTADHKNTVWHFDAFKRRSDDYQVPEFTNDEGETTNEIENSFIDAQGANVGVSYIFDNGYLGASYGRLEQQYGIPGHGHGEEEHGEEEHEESAGVEEHTEVGPFADMWQNRIQVHGGWLNPFTNIERVELRYGFTDYQHQEIEDGEPSTTFTNNLHELRLTANHQALFGWEGAFGYHYFDQAQEAFGEEAYTPNSTTTKHGLFWLLERNIDALNWQVGARVEDVDVNDYSFTPVSASVGFTYPLIPGMQLSTNLSHAQRAPSANELLSNGAHLATQTYEIGLAYSVHEEAEHAYHIEPADVAPEVEVSNNIDIGLHLDYSHFHMDWNVFYNRVNDFVYGAFTGINSVDIEAEGEHNDGDVHDHAEGLPVISYVQRNVDLYGYELSTRYEFNEQWQLHGFSDYVRAKVRDGGENLPRIPSQRIGAELRYAADRWETKLGYTWYNKQTYVAPLEEKTDSFGLVNAQLNWFPQALAAHNISLYFKAENLTDELGYVHSSFLKEDAPMRGRNFSIGLRGEF
ncbi:TonB-dependent receptor domain-containing protein [Pseudidiomarina andamanensis]|uniref:TonB-dependent receptor n=1 Tax=Pseudidiomarina andamanensis TaxID=1940690 RepID=A0AA92EUE4_9GAMM|nr:TonB-dependent receptor [Pseudidiomarina andamanensis]MDS0217899.1 TonB-dependent receptor [Pseudidiomarina andamanensis]QGT94794.1 TonB-dependent receptor [Pseudidiomarina andamanensis]